MKRIARNGEGPLTEGRPVREIPVPGSYSGKDKEKDKKKHTSYELYGQYRGGVENQWLGVGNGSLKGTTQLIKHPRNKTHMVVRFPKGIKKKKNEKMKGLHRDFRELRNKLPVTNKNIIRENNVAMVYHVGVKGTRAPSLVRE